MATKPLWLLRMSAKAKARLLGKAHAIILDESQRTNMYTENKLRETAAMIWMIKCHLERKAANDDNSQ